MKLVLLGSPGSGKGTYASRVSKILNIPHISSGDAIKTQIAAGTELGLKAKPYIESGNFAPIELVMGLFIERLTQEDCKNGFIFDCPYNLEQAQKIDADERTKIDLVLNIVVPENIILRRLTSRRVCDKCGAIYNVTPGQRLLPKKEGICDKCGAELIHRMDDKEEAIKKRLEIYEGRAKPMVEYYKKDNRVLEIKWDEKDIPEGEVDIPADLQAEKIAKIIRERD